MENFKLGMEIRLEKFILYTKLVWMPFGLHLISKILFYHHYLNFNSIVTGAADEVITILDKGTYATLLKFSFDSVVKTAIAPKIKSVCFAPDQKTLLVGTYGSEIYEISTKY